MDRLLRYRQWRTDDAVGGVGGGWLLGTHVAVRLVTALPGRR